MKINDLIKQNKENKDINWYPISQSKLKDLKNYYSLKTEKGRKAKDIEKIEISEFGEVRVKYFDNKKPEVMELEDEPGKPGYVRIKYYPGFGYIYILAADAFCRNNVMPKLEDAFPSQKECTYDVHHVNNNGYLNTPDNLVLLKRCEHQKIHESMNFPNSCKECYIYKELIENNRNK